jgi:hypothetical protein
VDAKIGDKRAIIAYSNFRPAGEKAADLPPRPRPASSDRSSTAGIRWTRPPRRTGASKPATRRATSSRCEARTAARAAIGVPSRSARGHPAIPVFVVLDADLRELGALVERPARTTAEMVAETRRFQQDRADLAGVRRAVERMPDETRAMLQHHISAWRDGQHDWWTRYLLEDLAVVANRDDRWPAA